MFYKLAYKLKRRRFRGHANDTPVQPLFEQPPMQTSARVMECRFLVIDCEMSGLEIKSKELLSIGWVVIEHGRIINASARHLLIQSVDGAGQSSKIHGLHDSSLAGASSLASVLMLLIRQMPGAVLVFHHAGLDVRFIQKASMESFRCPMLFSYIDTMRLEKQRLRLQGRTAGLRLAQCRQRYGLGPVSQHNALADAQATAELLLAQLSYSGDLNNLRLSDLGLSVSAM